MSELWKKYIDDPRKICKYGVNCYQKNPQHHADYKHPPPKGKRRLEKKPMNPKRTKIDEDETNMSLVENTALEKTKALEDTSIAEKAPEVKTAVKLVSLPKDITFYDPTVKEELFKELFLVNMPTDFYKFYEYLKEEGNADLALSRVNLQLIGPYELLMGRLPIVDDKDLYLIHWRFFYDPPEFQSVLKKKGNSEYHIGYFRDNPDEDPVFVGSNDSSKDCVITPIATNIFVAVIKYLENEKRQSPFTSMACQKFIDKVKVWAEKHNVSLEPFDMKQRLQQIVTRSLHGAGVVVPYNKTTQIGYRKLIENDATIKKILKSIETASSESEKDEALSKLQPIITYASIGVDECDFGVGLEMGLNLFASGLKDLERSAISLLCSAYTLLKRDSFHKIIQVNYI